MDKNNYCNNKYIGVLQEEICTKLNLTFVIKKIFSVYEEERKNTSYKLKTFFN